jgi:hypothetical protein
VRAADRIQLTQGGAVRTFDIKDPRDLDEQHIELRMRCTEVVA